MENEFWLNLSSKDLQKSREFFTQLGFKMNDRHTGPDMVSMFVGNKHVVLNLFSEKTMQSFINHPVTNTSQSNEIIFSIGANSPSEVDEMAQRAVAAGAQLFAKPGYKDGWMDVRVRLHRSRRASLEHFVYGYEQDAQLESMKNSFDLFLRCH